MAARLNASAIQKQRNPLKQFKIVSSRSHPVDGTIEGVRSGQLTTQRNRLVNH
jgi:hypothetical protein